MSTIRKRTTPAYPIVWAKNAATTVVAVRAERVATTKHATMQENARVRKEVRIVGTSAVVLGKSVSKTSVVNLNARARTAVMTAAGDHAVSAESMQSVRQRAYVSVRRGGPFAVKFAVERARSASKTFAVSWSARARTAVTMAVGARAERVAKTRYATRREDVSARKEVSPVGRSAVVLVKFASRTSVVNLTAKARTVVTMAAGEPAAHAATKSLAAKKESANV